MSVFVSVLYYAYIIKLVKDFDRRNIFLSCTLRNDKLKIMITFIYSKTPGEGSPRFSQRAYGCSFAPW